MGHDTIDSLSEFLLHAGTEYRVFDMGRGLRAVEQQPFLELENGSAPVPFPRQGKAWFAVAFWQASHAVSMDAKQQFLWFLSLPIDEESRIVSASRNHFLQLVVEALQKDPNLENGLPDNPYVFTPTETQRGQVSAQVYTLFNEDINAQTQSVKAYLSAPGAFDWQKLVAQDIYLSAHAINADLELTQTLILAYNNLSTPFKTTLLKALEVIQLNDTLQQFLIDTFNRINVDSDKLLILQAIGEATPNIQLQSLVASILSDSANNDIDLLSVIAARHWAQLSPGILRLFFTACIQLDEKEERDGELFVGFYKDLVAIPALRQHAIGVLKALQTGNAP
jgi:hypothetical protein